MNYYQPRFLSLHTIRHKSLSTLKSKNDELANQALLQRLKNISVIMGKKIVPTQSQRKENTEPAAIKQPTTRTTLEPDPAEQLPPRTLTFEKVDSMIKYHTSDPLVWNPSVLSRVYKIPEDYCVQLVRYVQPMLFLGTYQMSETQKFFKTTVVVDVARFKMEDNYLVVYKRIAFPKKSEKLPTLPVIKL